MAATNPRVEDTYGAEDETNPTPWATARKALEQSEWFWLATVRPDGSPHAVPVLAVWVDESLHFVASPSSRKSENLSFNPRCVVTTRHDGLDLVIEGTAAKVKDESRLRTVADVYESKYAWLVDIRDGAFYAEGAPTAGPPPFEVYQVTTTTAFGFPAGKEVTPTRWRF